MSPLPSTEKGAAGSGALGKKAGGCWVDDIDTEACMFCGKEDYQQGFGPRLLVTCSCCNVKSFHVECLEKQQGQKLDDSILLPDTVVLCSKECEKLDERWAAKCGCRMPVKGEASMYTIEIVKYKEGDRGSAVAVENALKIFRSYFKKSIMGNGRDLLEMVCQAYETPQDEIDAINEKDAAKAAAKEAARTACGSSQSDEEADEEDDDDEIHNFGGFRVLVLRKGGVIVTVATVRLYGPHFAEMPFVATRQDYRREGNCRRLVKGVEEILEGLGVKYLVLPSMNEVLPMWLDKFGFEMLTEHEHEKLLECNIVDMDQETAHLVKKRVGAPTPAPSTAGGRTTRAGSKRSAPNQAAGRNMGKRSKLSSSWGKALVTGRGRGRPAKGADDESESSDSPSEQSDDDEDSDAAEELRKEAEEDSGSDAEVEMEEAGDSVAPARKRRAPAPAPRARAASPVPDAKLPAVPAAGIAAAGAMASQPAGVTQPGAASQPATQPDGQPKRYKITMEDKRRMDAERLGIPYVPGKPLIYPIPEHVPRAFPPPLPRTQAARQPRVRNRAQPRSAAAHNAAGQQGGAPAGQARMGNGAGVRKRKRDQRRALMQRAVKLRIKLAARARAAVRQDALLALTLAEAVAASVAEKQRAVKLQQELNSTQSQVCQLAAREQQLAALLKQYGVQVPPPPAAISHIIAAPVFLAPSATGALPWVMHAAAPAPAVGGSLSVPPTSTSSQLPVLASSAQVSKVAEEEQEGWLLDADADASADAAEDVVNAPAQVAMEQGAEAGTLEKVVATAEEMAIDSGCAANQDVGSVPTAPAASAVLPEASCAADSAAPLAAAAATDLPCTLQDSSAPTTAPSNLPAASTAPVEPAPAPSAVPQAPAAVPLAGAQQEEVPPSGSGVLPLQDQAHEASPFDLLLQSTLQAPPVAAAAAAPAPAAAAMTVVTNGVAGPAPDSHCDGPAAMAADGCAQDPPASTMPAPQTETSTAQPPSPKADLSRPVQLEELNQPQEQEQVAPVTKSAQAAAVSPPAGAHVAGVSPPGASTPFATPRTLRAFDEKCLGRLLPRVLSDVLAPSPLIQQNKQKQQQPEQPPAVNVSASAQPVAPAAPQAEPGVAQAAPFATQPQGNVKSSNSAAAAPVSALLKGTGSGSEAPSSSQPNPNSTVLPAASDGGNRSASGQASGAGAGACDAGVLSGPHSCGSGSTHPRSRPPVHDQAARAAARARRTQRGSGGTNGLVRRSPSGTISPVLSLFGEALASYDSCEDLGRASGRQVSRGRHTSHSGEDEDDDSDSPVESPPQQRSIYRPGGSGLSNSSTGGKPRHRRGASFTTSEFDFLENDQEDDEFVALGGLGPWAGLGGEPSEGLALAPLRMGSAANGDVSMRMGMGSGAAAAGVGPATAGNSGLGAVSPPPRDQAAAGPSVLPVAVSRGSSLLRGLRARGMNNEAGAGEALAGDGSWSQDVTASWGGLYGGPAAAQLGQPNRQQPIDMLAVPALVGAVSDPQQGAPVAPLLPLAPSPQQTAAAGGVPASEPSSPPVIQQRALPAALAYDTPAPHLRAPPPAALLPALNAPQAQGVPGPLLLQHHMQQGTLLGQRAVTGGVGGGSSGTMQAWRVRRVGSQQDLGAEAGSGSPPGTCSTQRGHMRCDTSTDGRYGTSKVGPAQPHDGARSAKPLDAGSLTAAGAGRGSGGSGSSTDDAEDEEERVRLALRAISSFYWD